MKDEVQPISTATQNKEQLDSEEPDDINDEADNLNENEEEAGRLVDDDEKYYRPMMLTEY